MDTVAANGGTILHVERLLGIRERTKLTRKVNQMLASWTFHELLALIHYKAARMGIAVVEVNPRHTSVACPECGSIDKANRKAQATFHCTACDYEANADYVGARNIAAK